MQAGLFSLLPPMKAEEERLCLWDFFIVIIIFASRGVWAHVHAFSDRTRGRESVWRTLDIPTNPDILYNYRLC